MTHKEQHLLEYIKMQFSCFIDFQQQLKNFMHSNGIVTVKGKGLKTYRDNLLWKSFSCYVNSLVVQTLELKVNMPTWTLAEFSILILNYFWPYSENFVIILINLFNYCKKTNSSFSEMKATRKHEIRFGIFYVFVSTQICCLELHAF